MKLNNLLLPAVSLLALNAGAKEKKAVSKPVEKPNIVFILADDMGYRELGSYGGKVIETPNLDALAQQGMRFTNAYCGSNISAPSRCSLLTGKHTGNAWIRDNRDIGYADGNVALRDSEVTVAEVLKGAGYTTGAFGKWGLGAVFSEGSPMKQGFDHFYGYVGQQHAHNYFTTYLRQNEDSVTLTENIDKPFSVYSPVVIEKEALKFIEKNQSKPFFLYFSPTLPHNPYHQPDDSLLAYYAKKTGYPVGDPYSEDFSVPKYAALSARLDAEVGSIVAKLKELNIFENTLIIFASDNGSTLKDVDDGYLNTGGELHGRKSEVYEGGVKTPLIACWEGKIKPGTSSEILTGLWDFLPTCAEIVNVNAPAGIDGISYLPTLLGKDKKQIKHKYLYWERSGAQGIRMGDMKAVIFNQKDQEPKIEIYDLAKDPSELNDLSASMPELKAQFLDIAKNGRVESELFPLIKKEKKTKKQTSEE